MLHVNKSSQSPPTSSQKVKEWKLSNIERPSVIQSKYINASLKCFPVMFSTFGEVFLICLFIISRICVH